MENRVLISGGTGFVGSYLSEYLINRGYKISILSRKLDQNTEDIHYYIWDVENNKIDKNCLHNVQIIIHLAGENVAASRWSDKRKTQLLESRLNSTLLLYNLLERETNTVNTFISASATGIYGSSTTDHVYREKDLLGADFLADVCLNWEAQVFKIKDLGIRTVVLRTGLVLAKDNGALAKMIIPFKLGLGSALASGKQYTPWIHIEDLCKMYLYALENSTMENAYNAVVGDDINNEEFSKTLSKVLKKPFFMPRVPKFILTVVFGEMAVILTEGSRVSSEKIRKEGFKFSYPRLIKALQNLLA